MNVSITLDPRLALLLLMVACATALYEFRPGWALAGLVGVVVGGVLCQPFRDLRGSACRG